MKISHYEVELPVYKRGDDLAYQLRHNASISAALRAQIDNYRRAAEILEKIASDPDVERLGLYADCHLIQLSGPKAALTRLARAKVIEKVAHE